MPPGITYWEKIVVQTAEGDREISVPKTRPLAACRTGLDDDDVLALLDELHGIARKRRLDLTRLPPYPHGTHHVAPDEACTISALPRASRPGGTLLDVLPSRRA